MEEKHAIEVTDLVISYQNLKKTSIKKNIYEETNDERSTRLKYAPNGRSNIRKATGFILKVLKLVIRYSIGTTTSSGLIFVPIIENREKLLRKRHNGTTINNLFGIPLVLFTFMLQLSKKPYIFLKLFSTRLAERALLGSSFSFIDVTAYGTDEFLFHNGNSFIGLDSILLQS